MLVLVVMAGMKVVSPAQASAGFIIATAIIALWRR